MQTTLKNFVLDIDEEGKPKFTSDHQRMMWRQFLSQFKGKKVWVTIDPKEPKRSSQQNNYYWLYLGIIAEETGERSNELHELFKGKFLTKEIKEVMGEKVRIKNSSTGLSKSEFTEFIMDIESFTEIPSPDTTPYHRPDLE